MAVYIMTSDLGVCGFEFWEKSALKMAGKHIGEGKCSAEYHHLEKWDTRISVPVAVMCLDHEDTPPAEDAEDEMTDAEHVARAGMNVEAVLGIVKAYISGDKTSVSMTLNTMTFGEFQTGALSAIATLVGLLTEGRPTTEALTDTITQVQNSVIGHVQHIEDHGLGTGDYEGYSAPE